MKNLARLAGVFLLLLLSFVFWWSFASDYGDDVVSGTYRLAQNGDTSSLVLKPNHTFQQELVHAGRSEHAEGSWRRSGEGGIALSKEFLRVSGQEPGPDGTAYGEMHKTLGIFVSLALAQYHVLWYGRANPSSDGAVAGTYNGDEPGVSTNLILKPDHTFDQTVVPAGGVSKHANGTWNFNKSGDIVFSKEFLKTSGETLREDETASAWDPKGSNLQIQIAIDSRLATPIFRKKYFPW